MSHLRQLIRIKLHVALLTAGVMWTTAFAAKSIVEEHAVDLFWMMIGVSGFLLFTVIAVLQWVAISFMRDMKNEIKHIRSEYGLRIHANELAIESLRTRAGIKD